MCLQRIWKPIWWPQGSVLPEKDLNYLKRGPVLLLKSSSLSLIQRKGFRHCEIIFHHPSFVPTQSSLYEAGCPCPPMMWMISECMPQLLLWRRLNWLATNLRSSALNAKASTSFRALTVLVEDGKLGDDFGCKAHASSFSPQKSPGFSMIELKKPVLPPLVVELSSLPLIINHISAAGSPSLSSLPLIINHSSWKHLYYLPRPRDQRY